MSLSVVEMSHSRNTLPASFEIHLRRPLKLCRVLRCAARTQADHGDMNSEMLFSAFLDDETRSQLSDYDALAVIPSSALSKNDPSVADPVVSVDALYSLAFDGQTDNPDDDFWVKSLSVGEGGEVGGSGFSGDGAAIYNNDDESFVSYVRAADGKRRQQQEELSGEEAVTIIDTFGAALMYTLEDPLYGDCPPKFVTGDLVSFVSDFARLVNEVTRRGPLQ